MLPLIIISAKIPTHTFLDPNMLQQNGTTRSHVPAPGPQNRKESNRKGENPRSIVTPELEHAGSRHGGDDGM